MNAETSATNADYKKVWIRMKAFRADAYLWWQVAEYGFDTFMIRNRAQAVGRSQSGLVERGRPSGRPRCF